MSIRNEGWTYLHNSAKWHYFRGGRSLCGRFMLLTDTAEGYKQGNPESKENCMGCRRRLEKEVARASK